VIAQRDREIELLKDRNQAEAWNEQRFLFGLEYILFPELYHFIFTRVKPITINKQTVLSYIFPKE
jgi:hypothetical protein